MTNLPEAVRLINETLSTLDTTETTCEHCGRRSYTDWTARIRLPLNWPLPPASWSAGRPCCSPHR